MSASDMPASAAEFSTLTLDRPQDGVVVLTLNRPDRLNAMTAQMFTELERAARTLDAELGLRVVILTGAGRAFCAGYDLDDAGAVTSMGILPFMDLQESAARALAAVRSLRVPVIAAVNGAASGGGLSLALAADIRLAAPAARFNMAMVRIGFSAGDLGASWPVQTRPAGQLGGLLLLGGPGAGEPGAGRADRVRRHARGPRGLPGEAGAEIHRTMS